MQFYLATSFIFPRSLRLRIFAICFLATHLPLIGYCAWGLSTGRIALFEFVLLTLATVLGTALALFGIGALLDPIHALAAALNPKEEDGAPLPEVGDVIQTLYAGVHRAATATRAQMEDLSIAALEDPLTGIANRRGFLEQVQALPAHQRKGCLAIVDIDFFKQVNDRLGHDEGDRVLCAFADRLSSQIRRADMVARWGGEEFAILFHECIEDEADWTLARLAARMREEPIGTVDGRPITFSAGLCCWNDEDIEAALHSADEALYEAKRSGRDRTCRAASVAGQEVGS
ncbi:GGDEF domain-containing protein [Novosphingobium sp.]|jgi:diguanylate cyclase (GGDEF)-like protein|uniref:GGDEF domain-containing protein n=1 Tax=Novosphingobium sp. TaxID=1874826 RepID=UPI003D6D0ACE